MRDAAEPSLVTHLLAELSHGRRDALDQLVPLVYDELRAMARHRMARESDGHTLQATALVHEAFERLVDQRAAFRDRAHFFAIASRCMHRVLVDHARRRNAAKRPPRAAGVDLDDAPLLTDQQMDLVLAVSEALNQLRELDPRQADVAEMKYFGGLQVDEIAAALGISPATVKRDWDTAKLFLHRALKGLRYDS
jgi:RNA polymerase sigma factor (TIGR02999 family)